MIFKRAVAGLRAQDWLAITIELAIVIIGVFIGTQVANWNEERLERQETQRMLTRLKPELRIPLCIFNVNVPRFVPLQTEKEESIALYAQHGWHRSLP